jgi:hypothetical protein
MRNFLRLQLWQQIGGLNWLIRKLETPLNVKHESAIFSVRIMAANWWTKLVDKSRISYAKISA